VVKTDTLVTHYLNSSFKIKVTIKRHNTSNGQSVVKKCNKEKRFTWRNTDGTRYHVNHATPKFIQTSNMCVQLLLFANFTAANQELSGQ
jgi:hypothetical protein